MARYDVVDFRDLEGRVKEIRKALGARAFGGLAWVAIGAPRDGRYEPPEWG
ncbi:MAG: hypothetical protein H0V11_04470 [Actinobacteria bacterium]|nr:hypothetical protein [Actinomycetota bacterium]